MTVAGAPGGLPRIPDAMRLQAHEDSAVRLSRVGRAAACAALALSAFSAFPSLAQALEAKAEPPTVSTTVAKKTLDTTLPVKKGVYRLYLDYTNPQANRLYVVDGRNDRVVARYVSNGGKPGHETQAHDVKVRDVSVRPTWTPTATEVADQGTLLNYFTPKGPGPGGAMGVLKMRIHGNEYLHGTWDAMFVTGMSPFQAQLTLKMLQAGGVPGAERVTVHPADGGVVVDLGRIGQLGTPISYGCWNMSNPNVVELRELFGVGEKTPVHVLQPGAAEDVKKSALLRERFSSQGLGDRPLSSGLEYLENDYAGPNRYLKSSPYTDAAGRRQPADGWYLEFWKENRARGL